MKGEETLKALLEGKTLVSEYNVKYRLKNGVLKMQRNGVWGEYHISFAALMKQKFKIDEEFPLTFTEALKAMLDGKTVVCEVTKEYKQRSTEEGFEHYHPAYSVWEKTYITNDEQGAKWKVVE